MSICARRIYFKVLFVKTFCGHFVILLLYSERRTIGGPLYPPVRQRNCLKDNMSNMCLSIFFYFGFKESIPPHIRTVVCKHSLVYIYIYIVLGGLTFVDAGYVQVIIPDWY
ncbi:hypothetical protein Dimus_031314 [Dionaea muscipula]